MVAVGLIASMAVAWGDEPTTWTVVERCAATGAPPGKGMFEVRLKTKGVETKGIDIRGCGRNRAFHKTLNWGGDFMVVKVYAVPFFRRDRFDILLERGWDDGADYSLLTAAATTTNPCSSFPLLTRRSSATPMKTRGGKSGYRISKVSSAVMPGSGARSS